MTSAGSASDKRPPAIVRRYWWVALVVLLLAAIGLGLAAANGSGAGSQDGGPTPSASAVSTPPTPGPTASGEPTAEPAPGASPEPAPTVGFGETATVVPQVTVTLTDVEAVEGEANGPGEVAGPALRFTIRIENTTGAPIDLGTTVVNAYHGTDQTPSAPLSGPDGQPFPAQLDSGGTATGRFVFGVPEGERDIVRATVDYTVGAPVVVFEGRAPVA